MKQQILLLFSACTFLLSAQESYEFKLALPPNGEIVQAVDARYFGSYRNEETGTVFIFDQSGVSMQTIIHSYLTKEQVRESSKFQVRNNYVFGVIEGDSIPCLYEDGKYYFGIKQKTKLNEGQTKAVLKKVSESSYIINFVDGPGYTPSMISFKGDQLVLKHFDYPSDTDVFDAIESKEETEETDYVLVLLNPNQKEWEALDPKIIFDKDKLFVKMQ